MSMPPSVEAITATRREVAVDDHADQEMNLHLEKSNLYLRFDKQQAFLGEPRFSSNDPIHFKIHFRNKTAGEIVAICKDAGLLP